MNFNQQNVWGILIGGLTAIAGWTINQWAAAIGIIGVLVNLYFAWHRHVREKRAFLYQTGLREDRRESECERCDLKRRADDAATMEADRETTP